MQTSLVHMRHPIRFVRKAGLQGHADPRLPGGGHAVRVPRGAGAVGRVPGSRSCWGHAPAVQFTGLSTRRRWAACSLVIGNSVMIVCLRAGRDPAPPLATSRLWALLLPFYWVLHSIAAWRALGQLITKPSHWEKTPHGITRHATPPAAWPAPPLPSHHQPPEEQREAA